jgi:hypothetical protein
VVCAHPFFEHALRIICLLDQRCAIQVAMTLTIRQTEIDVIDGPVHRAISPASYATEQLLMVHPEAENDQREILSGSGQSIGSSL